LYSIGEALIDFLPEGGGYLPKTGGAPANAAAAYSRLGGKSAFLGAVGADFFGDKIIKDLLSAGVDVSYIKRKSEANTALAFVSLSEGGEREFTFYRNPSADMFFSEEALSGIEFKEGDILHFCSVDLVDMPIKKATEAAIKKMKEAGGKVSFDPNVRLALWKDWEEYRKTILKFIPEADILKFSSDEFPFIFGKEADEKIISKLLETAEKVVITRGGEDGELYTRTGKIPYRPFDIKPVDTTGAGDSFVGAYLRYFKEEGDGEALKRAAATSAIVCLEKGVLEALPDEKELFRFIKKYE